MKVQKITEVKQNNSQSLRRQKVDMTGFGGTQVQESSMNSKNANEAIKNNFLSNVSFGGSVEQYEELTRSSYYGYGSGADYIYGTSGAVHTKMTDPIKGSISTRDADVGFYPERDPAVAVIKKSSRFYPNSSIENAKDTTHGYYTTNRIYFADPEEVVTEQTRKDHDYIVYDNRPKYPKLEDLRKNYTVMEGLQSSRWYPNEGDSVNYADHFNTVREYYERLEEADMKEYFKQKKHGKVYNYDNSEKVRYYGDRIGQSRHHQQIAKQAIQVFEEAGDLFMRKDDLRKKVFFYKDELENIPKDLKQTDEDIINQQTRLKKVEKRIKVQRDYIEVQKELLEENPPVSKGYYEDEEVFETRKANAIDEKLRDLRKHQENLETEKKLIRDKISSLKKHRLTQTQRYQAINDDLPIAQNALNEVLSQLWDKYLRMEEFYTNNIQEWQWN